MLLDGASPAAAAAMPDIAAASTDGISLADLYPNKHPTKHVIAEVIESEGEEWPEEVERQLVFNGPPGAANPKPSSIDTAVPGTGPATLPLPLPSDVAALAAAIGAAAGPDVAAQMGPEGFAAAAAAWLERAQAGPAPVLASEEQGSADSSTAGGRRLQQTTTFNTRQVCNPHPATRSCHCWLHGGSGRGLCAPEVLVQLFTFWLRCRGHATVVIS